MLLQLEHQHPPQQATPKHRSKAQILAASKIIKKSDQIQETQPIFFCPIPIPRETSSYNFHIDGIDLVLKDIYEETTPAVRALIAEKKKFCEDRVYHAALDTSANFVSLHMRQFSLSMKSAIQTMFQEIHDAVEAGIWDGRLQIYQSRKKYETKLNKERQLIVHITEELLKKNLDGFRDDLRQDQMLQTEKSLSLTQDFALSSQKTKKAEEFIKRLQQQEKRYKQMKQKRFQQRKQIQIRSMQQQRIQQQQKKREKQQMVRRRFEKNIQIMSLQRDRRKKIHSDYLKMMSSYKKPLYKQKQERLKKQLIQQHKKKLNLMQQMREDKQSISFQDIKEHMQRYEELRDESEAHREQKYEFRQRQFGIRAAKKYFRGKFHSLVEDQSPRIDEKEAITSLFKRKVDYADHVKRHFMPKTDQKKQQELQDLVKKINSHKREKFHSRSHIEEGKRNLERLHLLIGQLRAKNKIKQNIGLEELALSAKPPPKRYKNYLQEIRGLKSMQGVSLTIDYDNKAFFKDPDLIKIEAFKKQQKARQKQFYLNSAMDSMDIHTHMQSKGKIDDDYLESAKAKMAIIKRYNQNGSILSSDN